MLVVFLGPDGSGKTTIMNALKKVLEKEGKKVKTFYWRPGILQAPGVLIGLRPPDEPGGVNPDPYGHEKQNPLKSLIRFSYYWLDFMLGSVKISLDKGTIYLFDRYYCDMWLDKFRYNFTLPDFLIKAGYFFIKKPDLVVYLDNRIKTLLARKREIPEEDLRRNVERYKNYIKKLRKGVVVNNERDVEEVVREVRGRVLN